MTYSEMAALALENGFDKAKVVDTADILFDFSFVKYCAENLCGNYGANYTCPPDCGTPEIMREKILSHKKALVLQSRWDIADFSDFTPIKAAKAHHNDVSLKMADIFRKCGHNGFVVGASNCTLCTPCRITLGEKCAHPDTAYCCMSAYCIHVKDLAEKCGMDYDFVPGKLSLFGMYVFD